MRYADVMATFGVSEVVARTYEALEIIADDPDNPDSATGYQLLWFVDGLVGQVEQLDSYVRDEPGRPGWTNVLDVDVAVPESLPWLGQFVGVLVTPDSAMSDRDQVRYHSGFARGTPLAIVSAVKSLLTGHKRVYLAERDTSAWHYTVGVRPEEVPTISYAELALRFPTYASWLAAYPTYASGPSTLLAVQSVVMNTTKPGGDIAVVSVSAIVGGHSVYADLNPGEYGRPAPFPTYASLAAAFPTYTDLANYSPP